LDEIEEKRSGKRDAYILQALMQRKGRK
jgi:hypothetical protein